MRLLALDQKTLGGGWAFFVGRRLYSTGIFVNVREELPALIRKKRPEVLAAEDVYYVRNAKTFRSLSQTLGFVEAVCAYEQCFFLVVHPARVNSALKLGRTLKRKERKEAMMQFARTLTRRELTEDEADAVCIGRAGMRGL